MFKLVKVEKKYYDSIFEYRKEMLENKSSFDGCFCLEEYEDIEKWHLNNLLFESLDTLPPGYSLGYEYLYVSDDEVVGMVNIRPDAFNHPYLKEYGGHIGYSVKPSKRKLGIASKMLKDTLKLCNIEFKLDKVLITCFKDNEGSRKTIMNNGGIYLDEIMYNPENKLMERYWIIIK